MKYATLSASGYWNDTKEPFFNMTITEDTWDGVEDADDEAIFYYLDGSDAIGDHGDFTITAIE